MLHKLHLLKYIITATIIAMATAIAPAYADDTTDESVVVIELFTSQGCSSCPPADAMFRKILEQYSDVIGISLHVDYWDHLGWKDEMADPKHTERQEIYNIVLPSRYTLVTPQTVVHATGQVAGGVGASPARVRDLIKQAREQVEPATLHLQRDDDVLSIMLSSLGGNLGRSDVNLVHFEPKTIVPIARGELSGREMEYNNVVSHIEKIADWDGESEINLSHMLTRDEPVAVIVQNRGQGSILIARRLSE